MVILPLVAQTPAETGTGLEPAFPTAAGDLSDWSNLFTLPAYRPAVPCVAFRGITAGSSQALGTRFVGAFAGTNRHDIHPRPMLSRVSEWELSRVLIIIGHLGHSQRRFRLRLVLLHTGQCGERDRQVFL